MSEGALLKCMVLEKAWKVLPVEFDRQWPVRKLKPFLGGGSCPGVAMHFEISLSGTHSRLGGGGRMAGLAPTVG